MTFKGFESSKRASFGIENLAEKEAISSLYDFSTHDKHGLWIDSDRLKAMHVADETNDSQLAIKQPNSLTMSQPYTGKKYMPNSSTFTKRGRGSNSKEFKPVIIAEYPVKINNVFMSADKKGKK